MYKTNYQRLKRIKEINIKRIKEPKGNKHRPLQDRKGRQEGMRRQTKGTGTMREGLTFYQR